MKIKKIKLQNILAILFLIILAYLYMNPEIIKYSVYVFTGIIIIGVIIYKLYDNINLNKNYDMSTIDNMKGYEFEKYLINVYRKKGYKVTHVGGSGDYGADLILHKDNETIIIQAKRYSSNVGVKAVQEVLSAKEYYRGTKAIVVTNSYFTPNAINMARRCNVQLIDRNNLIKL